MFSRLYITVILLHATLPLFSHFLFSCHRASQMIQTYVEHIERTKMQQAGSNSQSEGPGCGRTWVVFCVCWCVKVAHISSCINLWIVTFTHRLVADVLCCVLSVLGFSCVNMLFVLVLAFVCQEPWWTAGTSHWERGEEMYTETWQPLWVLWEIIRKNKVWSILPVQCSAISQPTSPENIWA